MEKTETTERDDAVILANKVLEDASRDPDSDLSMLSRQLLRSLEKKTFEISCPCCRARMGVEPVVDGYRIWNLDAWNKDMKP